MDAQTDKSTTSTTEATAPTDTFAAAVAAMEAATPAPVADDGDDASEAPAEAAPAKADEKPEAEKPPEAISPQMAALAKREKRITERETKLKAEFAAREKALADKAAALGSVEELVALAKKRDAKALVAKFGLDAETAQDLAKALWYEAIGEDAPADYKAAAKARALEERQAQLEKQILEERQAREQERARAGVERARAAYAAQISAHLSTGLDATPLVRAFAEDAADEVAKQLFQIGIEHANANPDEPVLGPAQLAAMLEQELEAQVAPLKKRGYLNVVPKVESKSEPEAKAPSALTNQRAATASKKRTADLSDEERLKAAIKAMDEAVALRG